MLLLPGLTVSPDYRLGIAQDSEQVTLTKLVTSTGYNQSSPQKPSPSIPP